MTLLPRVALAAVLVLLFQTAVAQKVYSTVPPPTPERMRALSVVNLRAGPGTDHEVVGKIARGAWFEVRECHTTPGWCEVIVPGPDPAYVSSAHLQRLAGAVPPTAPPALPPPATVPIVVVVDAPRMPH